MAKTKYQARQELAEILPIIRDRITTIKEAGNAATMAVASINQDGTIAIDLPLNIEQMVSAIALLVDQPDELVDDADAQSMRKFLGGTWPYC